MTPSPIKHCKQCGSAVEHRIPDDGDTKIRAVCPQCKTIHYVNPLNVVGTIPVWGDKVLLCKRNIEPRFGKWTLPAGFMEMGETTAQGAARETDEEAGAKFEMQELFSLVNVACGPSPSFLPSTTHQRSVPTRNRNPRGLAVFGGGYSLGRSGVSNRQRNARTLLRRPQSRIVWLSCVGYLISASFSQACSWLPF